MWSRQPTRRAEEDTRSSSMYNVSTRSKTSDEIRTLKNCRDITWLIVYFYCRDITWLIVYFYCRDITWLIVYFYCHDITWLIVYFYCRDITWLIVYFYCRFLINVKIQFGENKLPIWHPSRWCIIFTCHDIVLLLLLLLTLYYLMMPWGINPVNSGWCLEASFHLHEASFGHHQTDIMVMMI